MSIISYGNDSLFDRDSDPLAEAEALVASLEEKLSVTDTDSLIYKANQSAGSEIPIDSETYFLLSSALDLCENTNGSLDISVYPLVHEWGFTTGIYKVPSQKKISGLLKNVDFRKILISSSGTMPDKYSLTLEPDMMIDLGAVAKGYTAERIAELLISRGINSAVISLGGNIKTIGSKPDGSDWNIAIAAPAANNPADAGSNPSNNNNSYKDENKSSVNIATDQPSYAGILKISDMSVVTSGGYERYFEENGKHYCHIIDPSTGYPADNGTLSVTVVAKDSLLCDALSTALFVMGREKAIDYWRSRPDFDFIMITDTGEILITSGIASAFTPDPAYEGYSLSVISRTAD